MNSLQLLAPLQETEKHPLETQQSQKDGLNSLHWQTLLNQKVFGFHTFLSREMESEHIVPYTLIVETCTFSVVGYSS